MCFNSQSLGSVSPPPPFPPPLRASDGPVEQQHDEHIVLGPRPHRSLQFQRHLFTPPQPQQAHVGERPGGRRLPPVQDQRGGARPPPQDHVGAAGPQVQGEDEQVDSVQRSREGAPAGVKLTPVQRGLHRHDAVQNAHRRPGHQQQGVSRLAERDRGHTWRAEEGQVSQGALSL